MQKFFSKVLLFGEHTVVNGSRALAIPFPHFSGFWTYTNADIDRNLSKLADYIDHHDYLFGVVAVDQFFSDLDRGLIFQSNIPMGYGLGSSGSLVAAVYKRYAIKGSDKDIGVIQECLGDLESHFHGKSSGLDPMVCYLNQAVLADDGQIMPQKEVLLSADGFQLFLMNTNVSRSTGPLVERYQAFYDITANKTRIDEEYIPLVDRAIDSLLDNNFGQLYHDMEAISGYQYAYLDFLIDEGSKKVWKEGLASDYFKVKICGAGGGGYLLGITKNMNRLISEYPTRDIIPIR